MSPVIRPDVGSVGTRAAPEGGRLRLLALIPTLQGGGSERVTTTLLRHFDPQRIDPMLAVVDTRRAELLDDLPTDLRLCDLGARRVLHALPDIVRTIRRERPHVVLCTLTHLNLAMALIRPLLPRGVKVVARESSILSDQLARERHAVALRRACRLLYRRLDWAICQSAAMRDDMCEHFGMPRRRTTLIPNPIDRQRILARAAEPLPPRAGFGDGRLRLLAVGRLSPEKGFDNLIRSLARRHHPRLRLDILGQGPQAAELEALIAHLGLKDRVRLHGFVANPYAWMRHADALVLTSHYEGLPNVVLEALACSTPVITTPVPSALEIVAGVSEVVVAEGFDDAAIDAALQRWLDSAKHRVPSHVVDRYDVATVTRRYEDVLFEVAGSPA